MDSRIDPQTGGYDGTRIIDLSNEIYFRITTPLGGYALDKKLGSKLHTLRRVKDLERNKTLAIQYTEQALQPLLDSKRADKINVIAEWNHDGRLYLAAEVFQHNRLVGIFKDFVKVA
ncbi:phage GP46 family protein [Herminiimonas arsenitoxidans]|uniref:phage GP46 family protein n=1 Tax=Herminiimonas arsenitoxidans TaxID=1809410 RepID=UPI000970B83B|nr:phage GP46 family protein [Herminiimonas arsenitoxidans]